MDGRAGEAGGGVFQAPQGSERLRLWSLPESVVLGGRKYDFHPDFRDILEIFSYWEDPGLPEFLKWEIALALFYKQPVAADHKQAAMEYLAGFVVAFQPQKAPGAKLLDWQHDAQLILADINQVAGQEIRALPFVHWWTFLAWFHGIGQGQLSTVVAIRQKLSRGQKLESWEADLYRENKDRIRLPQYLSKEQIIEKTRLQALLSGEGRDMCGEREVSLAFAGPLGL